MSFDFRLLQQNLPNPDIVCLPLNLYESGQVTVNPSGLIEEIVRVQGGCRNRPHPRIFRHCHGRWIVVPLVAEALGWP